MASADIARVDKPSVGKILLFGVALPYLVLAGLVWVAHRLFDSPNDWTSKIPFEWATVVAWAALMSIPTLFAMSVCTAILVNMRSMARRSTFLVGLAIYVAIFIFLSVVMLVTGRMAF